MISYLRSDADPKVQVGPSHEDKPVGQQGGVGPGPDRPDDDPAPDDAGRGRPVTNLPRNCFCGLDPSHTLC